ncbi:putative metalloprotease CJM1_0395 family protein [Marinimicrobium sp. C2-29]|uniref:putative metalloprotease CJM1_0395 family protein n=1 Tax=Marinimicrobium sp. C2-29 TaxID=3139825 RepID=UPI00313A422D
MTPAIPSNFANAVAPFVPVGRQPVGQENEDLRGSTLKPLEESAESARSENRRSPDERSARAFEQSRSSSGDNTDSENTYSRPIAPTDAGVEREQGESDLRASLERQRQVEEQQQIRELSRRDREVRQHEQAHAAIGGRYAGAPSYEFERGPDGVSYAVSGEVPIDTSKIPNDPEATLQKAQQIRRAAYAPAEPSDTDRRVAAEASRIEAEARAELRQEQLEAAIEAREAAGGETRDSGDDRPGGSEADLSGTGQGENTRENADSAEQQERKESDRSDELERIRRRNLETYLQLSELYALGDQPLLGSRLNQQV